MSESEEDRRMAEREISTETMSINDITVELERLGATVAELGAAGARLRGEMDAAVAARTAARTRAQAAGRWSRARRTAERDAERADRIAAQKAQQLQEVQVQAAEVVYRQTVLENHRSHKQWEQVEAVRKKQEQERREKETVRRPDIAARGELAADVEAGDRGEAEPSFWEGPLTEEERQERPRTPEERHVDDLYARLARVDDQDYATLDALERAAIQQLEAKIERDELDVRDVYEPDGGGLRTDIVDREVTSMLEYEVEQRERAAGIQPPEQPEADRGQAEQSDRQEQEATGLPLPTPLSAEEHEDQLHDRFLAMLPVEQREDGHEASDATAEYKIAMLTRASDRLMDKIDAEELAYDAVHTPRGGLRQDVLQDAYLAAMREDLERREHEYDQQRGPGARDEREQTVSRLREERWDRMEQVRAEIAALQERQRQREREQAESARGSAERDTQQEARRDDRAEEAEQPRSPQRQGPVAEQALPAHGPAERGQVEAPPVARQEPVVAPPPPVQTQPPAAPSRGAEPEL